MKMLRYFKILPIVLINLFFVANGQNYIPLLRSNQKYFIFNTKDSTFEINMIPYDFASPTILEKFILIGKKEESHTKWGLLDSETGKFILKIKYDKIIVRNGYLEAHEFNQLEVNKIHWKNFFVQLSIFDLAGNKLFYEKFANNGGNDGRGPFITECYPYKILSIKNGVRVLDNFFNVSFTKYDIKRLHYLGQNLFVYSFDDEVAVPKFGLIDFSGKKLTDPKFVWPQLCDNQLIAVSKYDNGLFVGDVVKKNNAGYVNLNGKLVIPYKFTWASPFLNGIAVVSNSNTSDPYEYRYQMINTKGQVIVKDIFDKTYNTNISYEGFEHGKIIVFVKLGEKRIYNIISKSGKLLFKNYYRYLIFLNENSILVEDLNGKNRIIDLNEVDIFNFTAPLKDYHFNKELFVYKYENSKFWNAINFKGKSINMINIFSKYQIDLIENGIIRASDSTGFTFFDFGGYEKFKVPSINVGDNYNSEGGELWDNVYPNKINNKFIVFDKKIDDDEYPIWFDFRSKIKYTEIEK